MADIPESPHCYVHSKSVEMADESPCSCALYAELEAARAVLREVEWADQVWSEDDIETCPSCRGARPTDAARARQNTDIGHRPDCRLAAALGATASAHAPTLPGDCPCGGELIERTTMQDSAEVWECNRCRRRVTRPFAARTADDEA